MARISILLAICALFLSVLAASPPSFCKCTCFTNSTIIPLSTNSQSSSKSASCSACNKAFCLTQSLPICKNAEEKDVLTTCFQRDSRKDQIVVVTFIAGTVGLLAWAGVRKILEERKGDGGSGVRIGEYVSVPVGGR